jgi:hypothetical protein
MTWPPPPPSSDPWESQTIPPADPPPQADDDPADADTAFPDPPGFEPVWEPPSGARISQPSSGHPQFPAPPPFEPDWTAAEAAGEGLAPPPAPDPVLHDAPPAEPPPIAPPPIAPPPIEPTVAEPTTVESPSIEPLTAEWNPTSEPVSQPPADLAPPAVAEGWHVADEPVAQPVAEPGQPPSYDAHWNPPTAPTDGPVDGPPPEYGPGDGQWAGLYNGPPPVVPRQTRRAISGPGLLIGAGTLAVVAVVAVLAVWLMRPSPAEPPATPATTSSAPVDTEAQDRLLDAVPAGYGPQACRPAEVPDGADAKVACAKNADPGGPDSATYTRYPDKASLETAFNAIVRSSQVVVCPGRIQSPGPWRRNATPDKVSGVLLCSLDANRPNVTWTDVDALTIGAVESGPQGPTFDQLYAWWASHS